MSAQAQIQSTRFVGGPDFDLAGIQLLPANTPEHQGEVKQVLADDADLVAPLLPYSVLVVNHSGRKLLGVGVDYHWPGLHGQLRGRQLILTALTEGAKPNIIPVGGIKLFTPSQAANLHLSIAPAQRHVAPTGAGVSSSDSGHTRLLQDIAEMIGPPLGYTKFRVAIDSVIFEDYQFLGSSNIFDMVTRCHPEVHK